jgi:hypothetical protein
MSSGGTGEGIRAGAGLGASEKRARPTQIAFGRTGSEYPPPIAELPQAEHAAQAGASARSAQKERSDLSRGPISQRLRSRLPALTGEAAGGRVRGLSQSRAVVQLGSGSGRGNRSRRGRRSAFDRNRNDLATATTVATTIATTIATVATMATAMAAAALAAAAVTPAAARARAAAALVATTIAAVARRMAAVAAIAAAATKEASVGLLLTAHEGDSNQREKDRDTQNNNTVHPRILQLLTGTSKREN